MNILRTLAIGALLLPVSLQLQAQDAAGFTGLKAEAVERVESMSKLNQEIVDSLFSFAELGFQEFETQRYLAELLVANGFEVELGVAGVPSAWWARWGEGEPVIAIGSDVDGIPRASQMPGVAYRQPMIEGAPGHGEGHNSGLASVIVGGLAVKEIMERENLPGTIEIWPGVAEELLGTKAWYAREGLFDDVDAVLFTHVSSTMSVSWGHARGTGLISVEYMFDGISAHGAGDPWAGRSALDAVELLNIGWNYRREHLHPLQRSHYVINNGGDQPNVVPSYSSVWYFVREIQPNGIMENYATLNRIAEGAAMMTDTGLNSRVVGAAHPRHFNRPIALAMDANIRQIGMPNWSEDDQLYARALQELMGNENPRGLPRELPDIGEPSPFPISGGSDDIGDVSWNVPTVTLRFPSNVSGLIMHHWSSAMTMATPIAHKGTEAGAKVVATTMLDLLTSDTLLEEAWNYFDDVQTADAQYQPFIGPDDPPAIDKNRAVQEEFRPLLEEFYYDPSRFDTYLEQLGIEYPQFEPPTIQ